VQIRDVYYDTADHELHKSSSSLRLRDEDGLNKITLKRPARKAGGLHVRKEVEEELRPDSLRLVLELLVESQTIARQQLERALQPGTGHPEQVLRMCGLSPVAIVENRRHVRRVVAGEEVVATLSVDDILLSCQQREQHELEIEIEATAPSFSSLVAEIAEYLCGAYPGAITPTGLSKYERAMRLDRTPAGWHGDKAGGAGEPGNAPPSAL
jgi:inorganic triphosphatase YgiF